MECRPACSRHWLELVLGLPFWNGMTASRLVWHVCPNIPSQKASVSLAWKPAAMTAAELFCRQPVHCWWFVVKLHSTASVWMHDRPSVWATAFTESRADRWLTQDGATALFAAATAERQSRVIV